jgi:putative colanic acid biosynthesis UDP-glucose lipid carrier transferase
MSHLAQAPRAARKRSAKVREDACGPLIAVADAVAIVASSQLALAAHAVLRPGAEGGAMRFAGVAVVFAAIMLPLARTRGLYDPLSLRDWPRHALGLCGVMATAGGVLAVAIFAMKVGSHLSRLGVAMFGALAGALILAAHAGAYALIVGRRRHAFVAARRVLVVTVDGDDFGVEPLELLARNHIDVVARSIVSPDFESEASMAATVSALASICRHSDLDEIMLAASWRFAPQIAAALPALSQIPVTTRLVVDPAVEPLLRSDARRFESATAIQLTGAPLSTAHRVIKRGMDVLVSAGALFVLSPLLVLVALAIKLDTPGPALFLQTRRGFNGRPFKILKFRSMRVMEDGAVVRQASRSDARVSRVGRFIRKTSIDELPQLWNILRGDMSLVGPRPHAIAHDDHFDARIDDYALRLHIKPGLTGWAQVNGARGETPTVESMAERVRLDLWYLNNASIWVDVKIICLTALQALRPADVY